MSVSTKVSEYGNGQDVRVGKGKPVVGEVTPEQSPYSLIDPRVYRALPECPALIGHRDARGRGFGSLAVRALSRGRVGLL